jgi:hypothetical protein
MCTNTCKIRSMDELPVETVSRDGNCLIEGPLVCQCREFRIIWQWFVQKKFPLLIMFVRGPLSLVSTTEELLDRKVAAPV